MYDYQDLVLGAAIKYHKEYWPILKPYWNPEVFGELERIKIASAVLKSSDEGQPVCLPVIMKALNNENQLLLERIFAGAPIGMNVEWMLVQLNDWYNIRRHIPDLSHTIQQLLNAKIGDQTEGLLSDIKKISQNIYEARLEQTDCFAMPEVLESTVEKIVNRIEGKADLEKDWIKSSIEKLDGAIHGFKGGRFYIIAARPSVGKTSFATFVCLEAMKAGRKPLFFSNEMDKEEIMEKMISSMSGIPGGTLQKGALNDFQNTKLTEAVNQLAKMNILIDEKSGWSLEQLLSTVYKKHSKGECDMVFVDYLQQVRVPRSQNKHEQVSAVSDAMKKLSRDLQIPVIGLAQINRDAEKTNGKDVAPSLIHIKDSGSLEQDADVVMILHRKEDGFDDSYTNIDLRLAKNRHGNVGVCNLRFHHQICKYTQI